MLRRLRLLPLLGFVASVALSPLGPLRAGEHEVAFPEASPESQGLDSAALEALAGLVRRFHDEGRIAGAELLVVKNRRTVLHEAIGWKDAEDQVAMQRDTIFNIRSMSKPITGTLAQMLIDDGALALSDRLADRLDGFSTEPLSQITVDHLMTHRSGLPLTALTASLKGYADLRAIARQAAETGVLFPPGERFQYSDAGSDCLGALLEVAGGAPLAELLRARVFEPLGMSDSFTILDAGDPRWSRTSSNHMGATGAWRRYWKPGDDPFYPFAMGSQSVHATPRDYAKLLALWMDGGWVGERRLLSDDAIVRGLSPMSAMDYPTGLTDLDVHYGRLWMLYVAQDEPSRVVAFGHGGSDGTYAIAFKDLDLMVLYFTQSRGQQTVPTFERALDALVVRPDPERAASILAGSPTVGVQSYLGLYRAEGARMYRAVILHDGKLAVEVPGEQILALVAAEEPDRFTVELVPDQDVQFVRGDDGAVVGIRTAGPISNEYLAALGPPRGVPTVEHLMRAYVEAQGTALLSHLGVFRLKGTLEVVARRATGELTDLYDDRGRRKMTATVAGVTSQLVVDGDEVMRAEGEGPPRALAPAEAEAARLGGIAGLLSDWRDTYREVTVLYSLEVLDEDCWVVRTIPHVGPASTKYVSVDTNRLVAEDRIHVIAGAGMIGAFIEYGDWRDVEGVHVPFTWTSRSVHPLIGTIITRFEEIETHLDLGPTAFEFVFPDD